MDDKGLLHVMKWKLSESVKISFFLTIKN